MSEEMGKKRISCVCEKNCHIYVNGRTVSGLGDVKRDSYNVGETLHYRVEF